MFDTRPLEHDPSPEETAEIQRRLQAGDYGPGPGGLSKRAGWIAAGVLTAIWAGAVVLPWVLCFSHGDTLDAWLVGSGGSALVAVLGWVCAIDFVEGYRERRRDRRDLPRLAAFARVNELRFARRVKTVPPGRLFSAPPAGETTGRAGSPARPPDHESRICFRAPVGPFREGGRHRWDREAGGNAVTCVCSYLVFGLPSALPSLFLLRAGRRRRYLGPVLPITEARRDVGPEFAARYTVYGSADWKPTELSVFTYDLAELLDRLGGEFDIEVADRYLVLYTERDLDLADPRTWQAIDLIGDRVIAPLSAAGDAFAPMPAPLTGSGAGPSLLTRSSRRSLRTWQCRCLVASASVLTELVCVAVRWTLLR